MSWPLVLPATRQKFLTSKEQNRANIEQFKEQPNSFCSHQKRQSFNDVSFSSFSALRKLRIPGQINDSEIPIYFGSEIFNIPRIVSRIVVAHKIAGYLAILESDRPFNENDKKLIPILCDVISSELQKSEFFQNSKGVMYESFITDILDEKVTNMETVTERLKYLDMHLKKNLYILTVRAMELADNNNLSLYYLRDKLELAISGSKSIIYDNTVVIIISRSKKLSIYQSDIKNLIEFLKNIRLYGGLSRCFHKLTDARECYF